MVEGEYIAEGAQRRWQQHQVDNMMKELTSHEKLEAMEYLILIYGKHGLGKDRDVSFSMVNKCSINLDS